MQYSIYCPKCEEAGTEAAFEEHFHGTAGHKVIRCTHHLTWAKLRIIDDAITTDKAEIGLSDQGTVTIRTAKMKMHNIIRKGPGYATHITQPEAIALIDHMATMKEIIAERAWVREPQAVKLVQSTLRVELNGVINDMYEALGKMKATIDG
jgi:hypothetical protein